MKTGRPPKHGRAGKHDRTYQTWTSMIARVSNPSHPRYADYGGRGIAVCDRWRDFTNFLADMGEKPPDLTLERRDNNLGYSPDNCCWATWAEQARNKRNTKLCDADVQQIRATWASQPHHGSGRLARDAPPRGLRIRDLAATYGVSNATIIRVLDGVRS